jgi:hypothetical protein
MSDKIQRAKNFFAKNSEIQEVFFSSDGFLFSTKANADGHVSRLANKEIEKVTRAQTADAQTSEPGNGKKDSADADAVFLEMLQSKTKRELAAIAAEAGVEGVSGKETNAALIEKIVAHGKAAELAVAPVITPQSEADALAAMQQNAETQANISDEEKAKVATA